MGAVRFVVPRTTVAVVDKATGPDEVIDDVIDTNPSRVADRSADVFDERIGGAARGVGVAATRVRYD